MMRGRWSGVDGNCGSGCEVFERSRVIEWRLIGGGRCGAVVRSEPLPSPIKNDLFPGTGVGWIYTPSPSTSTPHWIMFTSPFSRLPFQLLTPESTELTSWCFIVIHWAAPLPTAPHRDLFHSTIIFLSSLIQFRKKPYSPELLDIGGKGIYRKSNYYLFMTLP